MDQFPHFNFSSSSSNPHPLTQNFMNLPPLCPIPEQMFPPQFPPPSLFQEMEGGRGVTGGPEHLMELERQHMQLFWRQRMLEISQIHATLHELQTALLFWRQVEIARNHQEFKHHHLPLARIKRVMKLDDEVKMVSAETPVLFSKACELFILEMTLRSWLNAEKNNKRILYKNDILNTINTVEHFDFLHDVVPSDDIPVEEPSETPDTGNWGFVNREEEAPPVSLSQQYPFSPSGLMNVEEGDEGNSMAMIHHPEFSKPM